MTRSITHNSCGGNKAARIALLTAAVVVSTIFLSPSGSRSRLVLLRDTSRPAPFAKGEGADGANLSVPKPETCVVMMTTLASIACDETRRRVAQLNESGLKLTVLVDDGRSLFTPTAYDPERRARYAPTDLAM